MNALRLLLVSLLVGGGALLVHHVTSGADADADWGGRENLPAADIPGFSTPIAMRSSEECRQCHQEVFDEWAGSHHKIAYTNPMVQGLSKGFQTRDCLPCHLPRPVYESGLGVRVLERSTRHQEGVDCFTCHFHPAKNAMVGTGPLSAAAAGAPCQPAVHESVGEMTMCAPCHNQHKVHDDWAQSRFAVKAAPEYQDCNSCHMPVVVRKDGTTGRDHRFLGAHDPEFLKTAASLSASASEDGKLLVEVRNDGTGHHFPADERHRVADLHLRVEDSKGRLIEVRLDRYRNPYREDSHVLHTLPEPGSTRDYEVEIPQVGVAKVHAVRVPAEFNPNRTHPYTNNMQIPAGEARSYVVIMPREVRAVTARLLYRTQPFLPDAEAAVLHELRIKL